MVTVKGAIKKAKDFIQGKYNEKGEEIMDPTPIAIPVGFRKPPTLQEQIQRYIRAASDEASRNGAESFEEAEDFDVGDDFDPQSPWELDYDHELGKEIPKDQKQYLDYNRKKFDEYVAERKKVKKTDQKKNKKTKEDPDPDEE